MNKANEETLSTTINSCSVCVKQEVHSSSLIDFLWQRKETRFALFGAVIGLPAILAGEIAGFQHPLLDALAFVAIILAGFPVFRDAWNSILREHSINANVLMTIAAIGAVFISAFQEAAAVMILFAVGEALEDYTSNRSRQAIQQLLKVVPPTALRLKRKDGKVIEEYIDVNLLEIGDILLVKPGERIPMDGKVIEGFSTVNQAPITGESLPVEKKAGSEVFASTINGEGSLEIEVTRHPSDNTINRLIQMVEESQERRAPVQRLIDRFAKVYTPAIIFLAAGVAVIPPLLFGQPFLNPAPGETGWLYRGLSLLVIGCPCALVVSTPVAIISAITQAARKGVIIKGGAYLEELSRVKVMAFDKTGTLTEGKPSVVAVRPQNDTKQQPHLNEPCPYCDELVALAYAVERKSEHPLAYAIHKESVRRGVEEKFPAAEDVKALAGQGIRGRVADDEVMIASHTYFDERIPHDDLHCEAANEDTLNGSTPLMIKNGDGYLGTITVRDQVRTGSIAAIQNLQKAGIQRTVMLSGDHPEIARRVSDAVGDLEYYAGLLPSQKAHAVKELQKLHGSVAMIGDGINDAPALAAANVGIAIGAAMGGTGQAMETADIALMGDSLEQLPFIYLLSKRTVRTIWANVIFALGIKFLFLLLVLSGHGSMWLAVFADTGTTLLVTLFSMHLLRYKA